MKYLSVTKIFQIGDFTVLADISYSEKRDMLYIASYDISVCGKNLTAEMPIGALAEIESELLAEIAEANDELLNEIMLVSVVRQGKLRGVRVVGVPLVTAA